MSWRWIGYGLVALSGLVVMTSGLVTHSINKAILLGAASAVVAIVGREFVRSADDT